MSEGLKGSTSIDNAADLVEEVIKTAKKVGVRDAEFGIDGPKPCASFNRYPGSYEIHRDSLNYKVIASALSGTYVAPIMRHDNFRGRPAFYSKVSVTRGDTTEEYSHVYGERYKERASLLITRLAAKYAIRGYDSDIEDRKAKLEEQMNAVAEFSTTFAQIKEIM